MRVRQTSFCASLRRITTLRASPCFQVALQLWLNSRSPPASAFPIQIAPAASPTHHRHLRTTRLARPGVRWCGDVRLRANGSSSLTPAVVMACSTSSNSWPGRSPKNPTPPRCRPPERRANPHASRASRADVDRALSLPCCSAGLKSRPAPS